MSTDETLIARLDAQLRMARDLDLTVVKVPVQLLRDAAHALAGATPSEQEIIDVETSKAIREYLWQSHGHHGAALYGDDGEMQCSACMPTWDYRRAPLAEVITAARQARWNTNIELLREASVSPSSEGWQHVTRFEVIDEHGRSYTRWNVHVEPSFQDEGRTLKVFISRLVAPPASDGREEP